MKRNILKKGIGALLFSTVLFTFSCKNDDSSAAQIQRNKNVNQWIKDYMDVLYLWNTEMPTKTDLTLYPADFFKSLLYTQEDRFSFIADDFAELMNLLNGVQKEAGYEYTLFQDSVKIQNVYGIVNYIKPKSPASSTDLKRGDVFYTVNGKQLTINNYQQLTEEIKAPHTLGISRNGATQLITISLSVAEYEENPVFLDSIYTIGGKKIAYLIYNFFASDKGDYSYTYLKQLNNIFGKFKQAGVNELVLDLRFDGGGSADVAVALASLISDPERTSSKELFYTEQYNSIVDKELSKGGEDYNKAFFVDTLFIKDKDGKIVDRSILLNRLTGLSRLYVLTSQGTASASELIINGLRPYMNVTLVGWQTYGKNVGMWFIYEDDPQKQKDNRWGMLPIVFKLYNSKNESNYTNGFAPDIKVNEYDVNQMLPLGDIHEALLGAALSNIGVVKASSALRSADTRLDSRPLASSFDRATVRRNVIVPQKRALNALNRSSNNSY